MKICVECFKDVEIRQSIAASLTEVIAKCDCCGKESKVVELKDFSDFFIELLGLFVKDDNGNDLIQIIQQDWNIFSSDTCAKTILSSIINSNHLGISVDNLVSYTEEIRNCFSVWERLKSEVQEEKRYFPDLGSFDWETYIISNAQIKKDTHLYRARITPDGKAKFKKAEMGCPPREFATAGRANPFGIPYLYLCNQIETTYYEVRAVYLDHVSVGDFIVLRDLNIVDFSNRINLFGTYSASSRSLLNIVKQKILFDKIGADLSKPLRRFDTGIEYVPTQLICEYCKLNGADGIRFNSSLHDGGMNVVLFNSSDVQCKKVLSKKITKVTIESS